MKKLNVVRMGYAVLSVVGMTGLSGCGSDSEVGNGGATVKIKMVVPTTPSGNGNFMPHMMYPVSFLGSNTVSQLESLKYVFGFISICEDISINGSAFSSTKNCLNFYEGPIVGDGSSGSITPQNLSSYSQFQIDLMDATSRAKLNQSKVFTSADVRSYNYAVINWYTPIAAKGCVSAPDDNMICTRSTGATYQSGYTSTTDNMNTSIAQEATVVSANGGGFFKFQQPFTITQADIDAKSNFTIDLVFNPEGVLTGSTAADGGNLRGSQGSMYVPMLNIAPVPRREGASTKRETYLASDCGSSHAAYRVELYSSSDSSQILGATGGFLMDSNTTGFSIGQADMGSKVTEVVEASGSITLKTPGQSTSANPWLSGLIRGVDGSFLIDLDFNGVPETTCQYTYEGAVTL